MSNTFIGALAQGQHKAITGKTAKERLGYVIAGVKDGKVYTMVGGEFAEFDGEDVEFVTEADMGLSRITEVKLQSIANKVAQYFNGAGENDEETEDEQTEEVSTPKKEKKSKKEKNAEDEAEDSMEETKEVQTDSEDDEIAEKVLKLIKKGKAKKALKLIDTIGDKKLRKKLTKKVEA